MPENYVNAPLATHLKHEMATSFGSIQTLSLLAVVAILAGLAGPFGTYEALSAVDRHFYWVLIVVGTAVVGHITGSTTEHLLHRRGWLALNRLLLASMMTTVPVFGIIILVLFSFGFRPDGQELLVLYAQCTAIVGGVTWLQVLSAPKRPQSDNIATPKLMARLPHTRRGRLIRLAAQDHYVEVITENGRTLISARFRDAIAETEPEPGIQVHRSHWVASHAVTGRHRTDDKIGLRMRDESVVPVGRKFRTKVRQKGLL